MIEGVSLAGVAVTPLRQIEDERGAVLHMMRTDAADFTGFGECYFSVVNPGAVKAWKRHRRQTQNLAVPVGRARFVICDTRPDSPTCGKVQVVELGRPDAYVRLHMPPLLWYGFTCISEVPALVANCADLPHDSTESDAVGIDSFEVRGALELLRAGAVRT